MPSRMVIAGASLAGLRAAETLRQRGFAGTITMLGAEQHLPYDRPPLSKKLLAGEWEPDRIALRKPDGIDELGLDLRLGVRATALDVDRRLVELDVGDPIAFDGLIIATGAEPRRLFGAASDDTPALHELRSLDDSLRLRAAIAGGGRRVVVVGAGFIGLEVAATARTAGCDVIVLEGAPAPLTRGLGDEMGAAVAAIHDDHDVPVRCGVVVAALEPGGIRLGSSDGELVEADIVVVGIGVIPATAWLDDSGLELRDGVVCDETLRAGIPRVYAAGDVARWPNPLYGEEMRIEHWTNAAEQGTAAADNLLAELAGRPATPYAPVPFFWSDQYHHRIQFLGRAIGESTTSGADGDVVEVVVGSTDHRQFVALYGRHGRLRGALGLDFPRLVMPYRRLLAARASWDDALELAASQRATQES